MVKHYMVLVTTISGEYLSIGMRITVNTKHLYNLCTTLAQRLRRCSNIVQMLYTSFVLCIVLNIFPLVPAPPRHTQINLALAIFLIFRIIYDIMYILACHTLTINVNDRVTHGEILKIIENAGH